MNNSTLLNLSTISDIEIKNLMLEFEQELIKAYNYLVDNAEYAEQKYNDILEEAFGVNKGSYVMNLKEALNMTSNFYNAPSIGKLNDIRVQNKADGFSASFNIELGPMLEEMEDLPPIEELKSYLASTYQEKLSQIDLNVNQFWNPVELDDNPLWSEEQMWKAADEITADWQWEINSDPKIKGWISEARGLLANDFLKSSDAQDYDYEFLGIPLDNKTNTNSFHYTTKTGLSFSDYNADMFSTVLIDIFDKIYDYNGGYLNEAEVESINKLLNMYAKLIVVHSKAWGSKFATIVSNADKSWYTRAVSSVLNSSTQLYLDHGTYDYINIKTTKEEFRKILNGTIRKWSLSFK